MSSSSSSFLNTPPAPEPSKPGGMNGLLVTVLVAVVVVGVLAAAYFLVGKKSDTPASAATGAPATNVPSVSKSNHPLAKYLEIVGLRVKEGERGAMHLNFVVVNHSAADLPELKMKISIKSDKKEIYEFPIDVPAIGPFESKDMSVPMKTSLKPYELPDWQFLRSEFEITSAP